MCSVLLASGSRADPGKESSDKENVEDEFDLLEDQVIFLDVESASMRVQSMLDVPSSVTVITSEDIARSGVTNIVDVLRRVPGVHVLQSTSNGYSVGMRGISELTNNRVLVLVDGRVDTDRLSGIQGWSILAIHPGDVDRIEIIRGPGSTLYGADALSGVINIVTKRATEHPGTEGMAWGQLDYLSERPEANASQPWMSNSGGAHLAHNWTNESRRLGIRFGLGLQRNPDWNEADATPINGPFHYSLYASMDYRPEPDWRLFLGVSHAHTEKNLRFLTSYSPNNFRLSTQALVFDVEKKHFLTDALTFRFELDARRYDGEASIPASDIAWTGKHLSYFDGHSLVLVNASLFDDWSMLAVGAESTFFVVDEFLSKPFYISGGLFINSETHLLKDPQLSFHLGARFELIQASEESFGDIQYRHISPRAALVFKPALEHSLRLSFATAYRTPTPLESYSYMAIRFGENPDTPENLFLVGNPWLEPEELYSLELGYQGRVLDSLRLEAVAFGQKYNSSIRLQEENTLPINYVNTPDRYQIGLELGVRYVLSSAFSTYLNYTFIYSCYSATKERIKDWPGHIYSAGLIWKIPVVDVNFSLDSYLLFDNRPLVPRTLHEGTISQHTIWEKRQAADQAFIDLRFSRALLSRKVEVFFNIKNLLGFFREPEGLRMYPLETLQPIGGAFLLGIVLRDL